MKHFLEETTNTHVLEASKIRVLKTIDSTQVLKIEGEAVLSHGEHGCIKIEGENVIKYVQQEFNPITRAVENAYD
ncbi:hypothetical protein P8625_04620 [Tenacibaculum tangerinum]|uniref:Uncharacterized protein n=1 Tax=Tenacibaculum tangerinum TaxID=3038772 RepID=A0ABY8L4U9_9FLAO|nr:hypothetical protein [Tenacibaculum tangerinum]WGH76449.1 hypothetical protein P8625_04620 [Tenacibaculum tangerinum]